MPDFSLMDKKYPYYVRYKAISAWLLKTGLFTPCNPTYFYYQPTPKKENRATGKPKAMPSKRSAVVTAFNLLGVC